MLKEKDFIQHHALYDWGAKISFIEKRGRAICQLYWFEDNQEDIYVKELHVSPSARNVGIATSLLNLLEQISKEKEFKFSWLWVKKEAWMHDWYKRRGYADEGDKDDEHVWMKKMLT